MECGSDEDIVEEQEFDIVKEPVFVENDDAV